MSYNKSESPIPLSRQRGNDNLRQTNNANLLQKDHVDNIQMQIEFAEAQYELYETFMKYQININERRMLYIGRVGLYKETINAHHIDNMNLLKELAEERSDLYAKFVKYKIDMSNRRIRYINKVGIEIASVNAKHIPFKTWLLK